MSKYLICKILIICIFLSNLAPAFAKKPKASLGTRIKYTPELIGTMASITPFALMPFINVLTSLDSSGSRLYSYLSEKEEEIHKEFIKNNKEKAENYIKTPAIKLIYGKRADLNRYNIRLKEETYDYQYALLQKMNDIFVDEDFDKTMLWHGLAGMLSTANKENFEFYNTILDAMEDKDFPRESLFNLYYKDTNLYQKNIELVTKGLKDGTYKEYAKLYKIPSDYRNVIYKYDYKNFEDNFKSFLLMKEAGFSDEQISSIINLKHIELIYDRQIRFNIDSTPRELDYRNKYKITKSILKNKKSTPEKKYKKLYKKLSKSKMERITHAPIIKQTLVAGDKFLSFPIGLLSIPHVIYFDPIAGTYAVTYKDWLDNITVRELMEKENKKNK